MCAIGDCFSKEQTENNKSMLSILKGKATCALHPKAVHNTTKTLSSADASTSWHNADDSIFGDCIGGNDLGLPASSSSFFSITDKETKKNKKRSVTFTPYASARLTKSRHDYTREEMQRSWYCQDEYLQIRKNCVKQIMRMESGRAPSPTRKDDDDDDGYCIRGLESHTHVFCQSKRQNRVAAYEAVLSSSYCLDDDDDGSYDDEDGDKVERIAQRYTSVSSICQLQATAVGHSDEIEAKAAYE